MSLQTDRLDHIVLTVADIDETCRFYETVLGMRRESFGKGRMCLRFGEQKINLHLINREVEPKARNAGAGTGDLCLITRSTPDAIGAHLESRGVEILDGPVPRTGALGPITSFYFRDPDLNLIELSCYSD